jgi:hypothetical protein
MMDANYNPKVEADETESGINVLDDYNDQNLEDEFEGLPYAKSEDVSPYAVSEAVESVPIPGINS